MIYDLFFLAQATSPQAAGPAALLNIVVPIGCCIAIFYFLGIRPQSLRQKEQQTLIASLKTGDKVVTASGIHGMIANVKETTLIIKVADNVKIEMDKASIASVAKRTDSDSGAS